MKIDRLLGILTILLQKEKATAPELAERFEVSRRTILRDIDTLCQAGIPVTTTRGGDGGISIMEGYKIQKSVLTTAELQHLIAGLKGLDSVSETSYMEQLLLKLAPENQAVVSLPGSMVIDLSSHYKDSLSDKIGRIRQAIGEKRRIAFDYYDSKGVSRRKIEPAIIEFRWNAWYVFGWCCLRRDFRRFKLNRLWELQITDEPFTERPVPVEEARKTDPFPDEEYLRVWFSRKARYRLIETYGLRDYEETEDGLLFTLPYTNKDYIFSWLLGFRP
jgi:predicted DNA-binding transcriptional regulator YafY